MKKRIMITCFLLGIIFFGVTYFKANAEELSRNQIREVKGYLRSKIMYTQKLYDCTPFQTEFFGIYAQIKGREGSNCHVQMQSVDCFYPINVAKEYSRASENFLRKMIDELDSRGTINKTLMDNDAQQMKRINYKYCQSPYN